MARLSKGAAPIASMVVATCMVGLALAGLQACSSPPQEGYAAGVTTLGQDPQVTPSPGDAATPAGIETATFALG
jgi:hypothetical protein